MKKINFKNLPDTTTPLSAENLNTLQSNIEESTVEVSPTQPTNKQAVWFKGSRNKFDVSKIANTSTIANNGESITITNSYYTSTGLRLSHLAPNLKIGGKYVFKFDTNGEQRNFFLEGDGANILLDNGSAFTLTKAYYDSNLVFYGAKSGDVTIKNLMLNEGQEALPYEPYVANKEILTYNGSGYNKFSVIESGSNENGSYIKFDDGTMICYAVQDFGLVDVTTSWDGMYESKGLNFKPFPQTFKTIPIATVYPGTGFFVYGDGMTDAQKIGRFLAKRGAPIKQLAVVAQYIAIGRWK